MNKSRYIYITHLLDIIRNELDKERDEEAEKKDIDTKVG